MELPGESEGEVFEVKSLLGVVFCGCGSDVYINGGCNKEVEGDQR